MHPELGEELPEQGVVARVVDEEAGIDPVRLHHGVRVAAGAGVAFEYGHVVRAREQVRGSEPGDAAADDCYVHALETIE